MGKVKKSVKKFNKHHLKQTIKNRKTKQKNEKKYGKKKNVALNTGLKQEIGKNNGSDDEIEEIEQEVEGDEMELDQLMKNELSEVRDQAFSEDEEVEEKAFAQDFDEAVSDGGLQEDLGDSEDDNIEESDFEDNIEDSKPKTLGDKKTAALRHKQELEELKEAQPEFYEFLLKNDSELLNFNPEEVDDNVEVEGGEDNTNLSPMEEDQPENGLTKKEVTRWQKQLMEHSSLKALRRLLVALSSASNQGDEDNDNRKYTIDNDVVYNKLVAVSLKYVIPVINSHLDIKEIQTLKKSEIPVHHKKWQRTIKPLVKSYISSILNLIEKNANQKNALLFIKYLPPGFENYTMCFPKFCRKFLKLLLAIWGTTRSTGILSENEVSELKVLTFLHIRRFAMLSSKGLKMAMRGIYLTYIRASKFTSIHTLSSLQFLSQCVIELYGQDLGESYQHAFVFIKQLAGHLRNAMNLKSKESYQAVYTWQVVHAIDLWARFLSTFCSPEKRLLSGNLPSLIFPLVQVTFGIVRLVPTARNFPLLLHCAETLISLAQETGTFIPVGPILFEVLLSPEVSKKHIKQSSLKPVDFTVTLKVSKNYLHTRVYQEGLLEKVINAILDYYGCYAKSIAFPELIVPAVVHLRRFIKNTHHTKFKKNIQGIIAKFEENADYIQQERSKASYSPSQVEKMKHFLNDIEVAMTPLGKYVVSARKIRSQRQQLIASMQNKDPDA